MRFPRHSIANRRLIDLVPVVNIVLLLMFFFLLSWSFVLQPGIEVRLPMNPFATGSHQGRHVITLKSVSSSKGDLLIFFDETSVGWDELRSQLKVVAEKTSGDRIILNADDSVSHGNVQKAVSLAMEHGLQVTIGTQRAISFPNRPS